MCRSRVGLTSRGTFKQEAPQRDGLVVLFVLGRIEERNRLGFCVLFDRSEKCRFLFQFSIVAMLEFRPPGGIVVEPFSQCRRWADLAKPKIDMRVLFRQAPRPQPIDQQSEAVGLGCRLIDAFDENLTHTR